MGSAASMTSLGSLGESAPKLNRRRQGCLNRAHCSRLPKLYRPQDSELSQTRLIINAEGDSQSQCLPWLHYTCVKWHAIDPHAGRVIWHSTLGDNIKITPTRARRREEGRRH